VPTHIKNLITSFLKDLEKNKPKKEKIYSLIEGLLDNKLKDHLSSYKVYRGNLIFYVDSAIWSYQLHLLKTKILETIKKEAPQIKNIKIKINKK
jgi:hypothetical protein